MRVWSTEQGDPERYWNLFFFFLKIFRISQHRAILKYENRFLIKWLVFLVKLGHCILLWVFLMFKTEIDLYTLTIWKLYSDILL